MDQSLVADLRNEARRVDQVAKDLNDNPTASVIRECVQILRGVAIRLHNYRNRKLSPRPVRPPVVKPPAINPIEDLAGKQ